MKGTESFVTASLQLPNSMKRLLKSLTSWSTWEDGVKLILVFGVIPGAGGKEAFRDVVSKAGEQGTIGKNLFEETKEHKTIWLGPLCRVRPAWLP